MANELGNYLRQCRGKTSLREFAEKCHISHTHLDSIEKGADPRTGKKVSVSTDTLRLIADGIGVDFLFLACLADGWDSDALTRAVIPAGYQPKYPFHNPPVAANNFKKKTLSLPKFDLQMFREADRKNPLLYSPQPVNILCCQYDIDAFLLSKICKTDEGMEAWANGYHTLPNGPYLEMYPDDEMAKSLADFFEVPVENLKQGVLPLFPKTSVWVRVRDLRRAAGYPATKAAPSLLDEAAEVAEAYCGANVGIQHSVRKLLDLKEHPEILSVAARKSDEPHPTIGPDTDVEI